MQMSNCIYNHLIIIGNSDKISDIISKEFKNERNHYDDVIDFNNILPCPPEIRIVEDITIYKNGNPCKTIEQIECKEKYGCYNCRDWAYKNWGTAGSGYNTSIIIGFNYASIYFETSWTSPQALMMFLSKKYPDVYFIIYNHDEVFYGCNYYVLYNGKCIKRDHYDNKSYDDEGPEWYLYSCDVEIICKEVIGKELSDLSEEVV